MSTSFAIFTGFGFIAGLLLLLKTFRKFRAPNDPKAIAALSKTPFGHALATGAADRLARGKNLCYSHKDYCGHGLTYQEPNYLLIEFIDGYPEGEVVGTWDSKVDFVNFLASQSDFSCSGADPSTVLLHTKNSWYVNNQRITKRRLREFVDGA